MGIAFREALAEDQLRLQEMGEGLNPLRAMKPGRGNPGQDQPREFPAALSDFLETKRLLSKEECLRLPPEPVSLALLTT
jgi:hypothetical protein